MIKVVCGIIFKDDKVLLTRRKKEKALGGYWEFAGGKVEDGESDEYALKREIKEELDLEIYDLNYCSENIHHYDQFSIHIVAYKCKTKSDPVKLIDRDKYEWVSVSDLSAYNIAEADLPLIDSL